jgi:hypothetical protein
MILDGMGFTLKIIKKINRRKQKRPLSLKLTDLMELSAPGLYTLQHSTPFIQSFLITALLEARQFLSPLECGLDLVT